jgi:hypothetical protein
MTSIRIVEDPYELKTNKHLQITPAREIKQGGTRLLWSPVDRLRLLSKWRL